MLLFPACYFACVLEEDELVFAFSATTYHEIATFPVLAVQIRWVLVVKRECGSFEASSAPLCVTTVGVASKSKADVAWVFVLVSHGVL